MKDWTAFFPNEFYIGAMDTYDTSKFVKNVIDGVNNFPPILPCFPPAYDHEITKWDHVILALIGN